MKLNKSTLFALKGTLVMIAMSIGITLSGCSGDSSEPVDGKNQTFVVTSGAFENGEQIKEKYTKANVSFPLSWKNAPKGTKSFAVFVVDLHPVANMWVHWVVINIPAKVHALPEGVSRSDQLPKGSKELVNSFNQTGYGRPTPPAGSGNHEYKVIVYALDVEALEAPRFLSYKSFQELVKEHVIETAEISGFLEKK